MKDLVLFINYPANDADKGLIHLEIHCSRKPTLSLIAKKVFDTLFPVRPFHCTSACAAIDYLMEIQALTQENPEKFHDPSGFRKSIDQVIKQIEPDAREELSS